MTVLGFGQLLLNCVQTCFHDVQLTAQLLRRLGVFIQNCFKYLPELRHGQLVVLGFFYIGEIYRIFVTSDALHILPDAAGGFVFLATYFQSLILQTALQEVIELCPEDIAENFLPFLSSGLQQLAEISLRDHGNLGKLLPGQADDVPNSGVNLFQLGNWMPIRVNELCRRSLLCASGSPRFCTGIFRIALHGVFFSAIVKGQFHIGWCIRGGILGAQHGGIPTVAAGLSKQGIGDSIENSGFACAGIACNQIEAAGAQLGKIQFLRTCVGAKAGNRQFQRSHVFPSSIASISSCTNARCISLIG